MIYTITLNPALDKTVTVPGFTLDTVNRARAFRLDPGGKGINVSRFARALGAETVALGIVGGGAGAYLRRALAEEGVETDFTLAEAETRTNVKIVDPERGTHTDLNEPGAPVTEAALEDVLSRLRARAKPGDLAVLAGKTPPGAPEGLTGAWVEALRATGARVYLDADGDALRDGLRARPHLVKPNEDELARLLGHRATALADLAASARALNADRAVVSLGPRGALFVWDGRALYAEALPVPVMGTVGAGDATVAALAVAESRGLAMEDAARLAIAAGSAKVSVPGTQAPRRADVERLAESVRLIEL